MNQSVSGVPKDLYIIVSNKDVDWTSFIDIEESEIDFWEKRVEENSQKELLSGADFIVNEQGVKYMDTISLAMLRIFKQKEKC